MSTTISAVFPDADAADLALRDLQARGCTLLSREISREIKGFEDPDRRLLALYRIADASPLPYPDSVSYISLRVPRVENRVAAGTDLRDIWSDRVSVLIRVPDELADRAAGLLINRGGSRVKKL